MAYDETLAARVRGRRPPRGRVELSVSLGAAALLTAVFAPLTVHLYGRNQGAR